MCDNNNNRKKSYDNFSLRQKGECEKPTIKVIKVFSFYFIHDGSKTGHPGLVVWKNDTANRYLVLRFDSDRNNDCTKLQNGVRHITKLNIPIDPSVKNSYIHNRPMLCKRKDIGKELYGLKINEKDNELIEKVRFKKAEKSPSLSKK